MKTRILLFSMLLTGCSTITMIENGAQFVVSEYCKVPPLGRSAIRAQVDNAIVPNKIKITCDNE